jgi:hypothetical protein
LAWRRCLSFFKTFRDTACKRLVDTVFSDRHHHDHCLPVSANGRGNEDSRLGRNVGGRRGRVLAEDDDAKRHRGNGANDLRGNSAGK